MNQNETTTYTCTKCGLPCETQEVVTDRADETRSLCCNATATIQAPRVPVHFVLVTKSKSPLQIYHAPRRTSEGRLMSQLTKCGVATGVKVALGTAEVYLHPCRRCYPASAV